MKATLTKITSTPTKLNSTGEVTTEAQAKVELVFNLTDDTEREGIKQLHDALDTGNIEIYIQVLPQHFNPNRRDESFPIVDGRGQFFLQYGEKSVNRDPEQMNLIADDSLVDANEAFLGIRTVADGEIESHSEDTEPLKFDAEGELDKESATGNKEQLKQIDFVDNDNVENPLYLDKEGNLVNKNMERIYSGVVHRQIGGGVTDNDLDTGESNAVEVQLPAAVPKG